MKGTVDHMEARIGRSRRHWSRWLYRIQWTLLGAMFLGAALLRVGWLSYPRAFNLLMVAGLAALVVALLSMLVFMWGLVKGHPEARAAALWAAVLGLAPVAVPLLTVGRANFDVPPIHDITTDLDNPPRFEAVLSLRKPGDSSADYGGEPVAQLQRNAAVYSDIRPILVPLPVAQATALAEQVGRDLGWRVIASVPARGRLEAVARTPLLGLSEDIVVRIEPAEGENASKANEKVSKVDVRSASRVGISDLGSNAKRIRRFLNEMRRRSGSPE
ncbi:DUF1499 domain-containing protein [Microbulbifer sp. SA54]|uniref:DUF1499 domain-containing protein n=1 Tax=Microbulbifer sp. SA54 TaxID=3401577 RepID=UPI003AAF6787